MYWRFCKCLQIPPCTGDFEFLRFPSCTGDLGFLWDLFFHVLGTYKHFFLYWNFVFLLISPCIEDFEFLRFSPCAEDFFYGISYVLKTLRLYKLSSYTGDFAFLRFSFVWETFFNEFSHVLGTWLVTNFPLYWRLCSLQGFSCTGDFEFLRLFPMYQKLWVWTKTIPIWIRIFPCAGDFTFFNLPLPRKNKLLFCIGYSLIPQMSKINQNRRFYTG